MIETRKLRPRVTGSGHMLTLATPEKWTKDINCATAPGQDWSETNASEYDADKATPERAAELCAGCPMIQQCLEDALSWEKGVSARNRYGIRGGLTPAHRALLDRGEQPAVAHACIECGVEVSRSASRCEPCRLEHRRTKERERYRAAVGKPLDEPLHNSYKKKEKAA